MLGSGCWPAGPETRGAKRHMTAEETGLLDKQDFLEDKRHNEKELRVLKFLTYFVLQGVRK